MNQSNDRGEARFETIMAMTLQELGLKLNDLHDKAGDDTFKVLTVVTRVEDSLPFSRYCALIDWSEPPLINLVISDSPLEGLEEMPIDEEDEANKRTVPYDVLSA